MNILAIKWYCITFQNLSTGNIYQKLASSRDIKVSVFRNFEKLLCKLTTSRMDLRFLNRCQELELIPDYLKFKPPELDAYKNIKQFHIKALKEQISLARERSRTIRREFSEIYSYLKDHLSICELRLLMATINKHTSKIRAEKESRHKSREASSCEV